MQLINLRWQNGSSAAAKDLDMAAAIFFQEVLHVFEKFDMTTLIRCDGNSLNIFLHGTLYNFCNGTIMAEMNNLCSFALQYPSHDIDGCIMSVKEACCCNNSDLIGGMIWHTNSC